MSWTRDVLLKAYAQMRTIRVFEDKLAELVMSGKLAGFLHLYAGEDAVAVGVCSHLSDRDWVTSTHRGHGHCIAKGVDVSAMMAELFGRSTGVCKGKGGSMHIADLDRGMLGANGIVGAGMPLAVGAGLTCTVKKTGGVCLKFALFFMAEYIKMIAVSAIAATLFFCGYDGPFVAQLPWLGPIYLLVKIVILLFGMIWVRATLPRIRYDRLMAFGWKMLFPLALGTVLITAVGISVNMLWLIPVLTILFFLLVVYLAKDAIGRR